MPDPRIAYVAQMGEYPIGVSSHLGDAQAAALARESKYDREPKEYRWDEGHHDQSWQLMVRNPRTGRWNKCMVTVRSVPIVDAPGD